MDRENYKEIVETMLSNEEYYEELHTDPQKTDRIKYNKFLKKYKNNSTQKEMDYLTNFEMKPSNFYGLPKVHKMTKSGTHVGKNNYYVEVENVTETNSSGSGLSNTPFK